MVGKVNFTAKRVSEFSCPPDKKQAFLWDATPRSGGLGLRITPAGKPSYIFQSRYQNKSIRITIGSPAKWLIPEAQAKAREYQRQIDNGRDPRIVKQAVIAEDVATKKAQQLKGVTVREAWARYMEERQPHWRESSYNDHLKMIQEAGKPRVNRPKVKTVAGPLVPLMPFLLSEIDSEIVLSWAAIEMKSRPARTRLAVRLLKAFLRWSGEDKEYKGIADPTAASGKKIKELVGTAKEKKDSLQREQLPIWFEYVKQLENPVIAAYLQCLVLTGARREELAFLKWDDVNFRWRGITIGDKVEGNREIPLTPYASYLMRNLPRRNEWVFSSLASETGRLTEPSIAHRKVCKAAGLDITIHGLRRSFKNMSEWVETPAGVVAQIMGHKPSAIAEKHYTNRPLDLLRLHHDRFEAWVLENAEIDFKPEDSETGLRVVSHAGIEK